MHCEANLCVCRIHCPPSYHDKLFSEAQWTPKPADAQVPYTWLSLSAGSASAHTEGQLRFLEVPIDLESTWGSLEMSTCHFPPPEGPGPDVCACHPLPIPSLHVSGPTPVAVCPQLFAGCPRMESNWLTIHPGNPRAASAGGRGEDSHISHGSGLRGRGSFLVWLFPTWSRRMPTEDKATTWGLKSSQKGWTDFFIGKGHFLRALVLVYKADNYVGDTLLSQRGNNMELERHSSPFLLKLFGKWGKGSLAFCHFTALFNVLFLVLSFPACGLNCVQLFVIPWTVAHEAPPPMEFSRQGYWSGLPFPPPGDLSGPRIKATFPALEGGLSTTEPPGKALFFPPNLWLRVSVITQHLLYSILVPNSHWMNSFNSMWIWNILVAGDKSLYCSRGKWG